MTILRSAARPVKGARPSAHSPADTDPAPTPARHSRHRSRPTPGPVWIYDRPDRLRALVARARGVETFLYREWCDARPDARPALLSRLAIVARRVRRLCECAR